MEDLYSPNGNFRGLVSFRADILKGYFKGLFSKTENLKSFVGIIVWQTYTWRLMGFLGMKLRFYIRIKVWGETLITQVKILENREKEDL